MKARSTITPKESPVRRTKFRNGLRLITIERPTCAVAQVYLYINNGYCWEPDKLAGISHVLEHNLLITSQNREGRGIFANERRALGAFYDAGTSYDFTEYLFMLPPQHLSAALELIFDGFFQAIFLPPNFDNEMGAILQESERKYDLPVPMLREKLYALAYRRNRRRRWRLGTPETLEHLTPFLLRQFYQERYTPDNIILTVAGNCQHSRIVRLVRRLFGGIPARQARGRYSPAEPPQKALRYHEIRKAVGQVYWMGGFHTPPFLDEKSYPLEVLATILGRGRGSRLAKQVHALGLVDEISVHPPDFDEHALFNICLQTDARRLLAAEEAVLREIARIGQEGVSPEEMHRARRMIQGALLLRQDDIRGQVEWLTLFEARRGDYRQADNYLRNINAVSAAAVQQAALAYLRPENLSIATIIPEQAPLPPRNAKELQAKARRIFAQQATTVELPATPTVIPRWPSLLPRKVMGTKGPSQTLLDKNIRLVTLEDRTLPTFALAAYCANIRNQETTANCGITALMQALMLHSSNPTIQALEELGAQISSDIGLDHLGFWVQAPVAHFKEVVQLMARLVLRPHFDPQALANEKQRLKALMRRVADNPRQQGFELLRRQIFQRHAYGLGLHGQRGSLNNLESTDLHKWHQRHVCGTRLSLAVVGAVSHVTARKWCQAFWEKIRCGCQVQPPAWQAPQRRKPRVVLQKRALRQTTTVIGYPAAPIGTTESLALDILWAVNHGDGGRFYDEIRGKRGLAYVVRPHYQALLSGGFFGVCTSTAPCNAAKAEEILLREYQRLASDPPQGRELEVSRNFLLGLRALNRRTSQQQAVHLARTQADGRALQDYLGYNERIATITSDQLAQVAQRYFQPGKHVKIQLLGTADQ